MQRSSHHAPVAVATRAQDEPLLRAYTACIIANVAFLEIGQTRVLDAGGVPLIVRLLKQKDRKVQLHSSAAVQNLTYKNAACCAAVLQEGGEKALNKLLRHKSEDIQQFAAGALANLQLYRRGLEADLHGKAAKGSAGLALDQKTLASRINAATTIQATVRGRFARIAFASRLFDHRQTQARKQYAQYGGHAQYGGPVQRQQPGPGGGGGAMGGNGFGRRQVDGGDMVSGNKCAPLCCCAVLRADLWPLPPLTCASHHAAARLVRQVRQLQREGCAHAARRAPAVAASDWRDVDQPHHQRRGEGR